MNVKPNPVAVTQFTYEPGERHLIGEISSTNGLGRVFDDACDEGLTIVSGNREMTLVVNHIERDADNDILWWDLDPAANLVPGYGLVNDGLTLRLFND